MNKLNLAFRETLIILFPGYLFAVFLIETLKGVIDIKDYSDGFGTEFILAILFGSILYSLNIAKKNSWFKNSLPINIAQKELNIPIKVSEYFKFYDSDSVSEEFKAKENIYTSLYHMFFNSSIFLIVSILITIILNCATGVGIIDHHILIQIILLIVCLINTYLIFNNKVKTSFVSAAEQFIDHLKPQ